MSIVDVLSPYKLVAEIVVIGGLAGGALWGVHQFLEHERQIGRDEVQARWDKQTAADKETARVEGLRLSKDKEEAERQGAEREKNIRTLSMVARGASNSLLDTLTTIRGSVPTATLETLGKSVGTLSTVLAKCQGRYLDVAERADRHASDTQTLDAAWPKPPEVKPP